MEAYQKILLIALAFLAAGFLSGLIIIRLKLKYEILLKPFAVVFGFVFPLVLYTYALELDLWISFVIAAVSGIFSLRFANSMGSMRQNIEAAVARQEKKDQLKKKKK